MEKHVPRGVVYGMRLRRLPVRFRLWQLLFFVLAVCFVAVVFEYFFVRPLRVPLHSDKWRLIAVFRERAEVITVLTASNGRVVASGHADGHLNVWSIQESGTGESVFSTNLGYAVQSLALSNDASIVTAANGKERTLTLWNIKEGTSFLLTHRSPVQYVAVSGPADQVATMELDGTINIWDIATQALAIQVSGQPTAQPRLEFSADGKTLIVARYSGPSRTEAMSPNEVALIETETGVLEVAVRDGIIYSVAASPDGQKVVVVTADQRLILWNRTDRSTEVLPVSVRGWFSNAVFVRGDSTIGVGAMQFESNWLTRAAGKLQRSYIEASHGSVLFYDLYESTTDTQVIDPLPVVSISITSDEGGSTLATGSTEGTVRIWRSQRRTAR